MANTPNLALPYPGLSDTADVPRDIKALVDRLDIGVNAPVVGALPGSPVDGQEIYYVADSANGVVWHLRYRTTSGKWEFLGGSPVYVYNGAVVTRGATTYGASNVPAGDPTFTLALAGDYLIEVAHVGYGDTAGRTNFTSYTVGATAAADADAARSPITAVGASPQYVGRLRSRKNGIAAGSAITMQHRIDGTGAGSFFNRELTIWPIRLG
jgi:hypothetical protein